MGNPSAVARMPEQLDVFRTAGDGRVYTAWWHGGSEWSNWRPIGGFFPTGAPVGAVARTAENLDLFIVRQRRPRLHVVVVQRRRLVRDQRQLALDRRRLPGRGAGVGGRAHCPEPRSVHLRQRRPRLHLVVVPRRRLVRDQRQLALDRRRLPGRGAGVGRRAHAGSPRSVHLRQRRPRLHLVVARGQRLVRDQRQLALDRRRLPARRAGVASSHARRITSICSSAATTAASTPRGGTRAATGPGSTTTGARSAASSRPGRRCRVVARAPDHLDLFVIGNDGRVYTSWWHAGTDWSGINDNWRSIGGFFPPGAPVASVARHPDHLDLFIRGNDDQIWSEWWHAGSEWSGINDNWFFVPPSIRLGFNMEAQQQTNWCWAAVSKSVADYYDPAYDVDAVRDRRR